MLIDDAVYFSSLLVCVSLGSYYKKIEDMDMKKNYGAGLGLLVATMICGHYIYHSILMVWGNIIIIKCCDKRYVHQMSIAFTWLYLTYLHFNLMEAHYIIWLHQTIALRLTGLAFEVYVADKSKIDVNARRVSVSAKTTAAETDVITSEPSAVDIITYAYFFIGLHKGPYYRWKIFTDHFDEPFSALGDCRVITEQKLKKVFVCGVGYMLLRMKYSPEVYFDNDFYTNNDADYRYLYNIPHLIMFFLKYQIVMLLCTSVCTETGFGVYPAKCQPVPGYGPSKRPSLLKMAAAALEIALEQEYNFSMLKCFQNEMVLLGPRMKDTMRGWDMPTQYWFWAYMYKNFVKGNKEVRSACSFVAWTMWSGPTLQQIIISTTLWLHIHLEEEYSELYNTTTGTMKVPWNIGYSLMRAFCLIYLTPCLIIDDMTTVLKYYNSIFWVFHWVLLTLMIIAVIIYKNRE